ncbi:MAG TPA: CinA family protein [Candidatus Omnitrophota bacterium]|nr:CinA family protein [Candidatus Omnitrophota bacterium]HPT38591.1 CinA family protein [Candidatus Omnitrophota bacterium]
MPASIIRKIHYQLIKQGKTIAVAESCTGGQLSSQLTSLPEASRYFLLGAVTYSNKSKELLLNIPAGIIAKYGAVSKEVAILMARNIKNKMRADFGLSITGIAGPGGATSAKPVGTVYICLCAKKLEICRKFIFPGNRKTICKKTVEKSLLLLCAHLSP